MAKKRKSILQRVRKAISKAGTRLGIGVRTTKSIFSVSDELSNLRSVTAQVNLLSGQDITPKQLQASLERLSDDAKNASRRRNRKIEIKWTKKQIEDITSRVQERLFREGLNSADQQMRKPKQKNASSGRTRNEPYRYDSGQLFRSIKVTTVGSSGDLQLSFRREKVIIESLIDTYGDMFSWSPSDKSYVLYVALKAEGILGRGAKIPKIQAKGTAPYNPGSSKRRKSR
jgi:hypothetical protein